MPDQADEHRDNEVPSGRSGTDLIGKQCTCSVAQTINRETELEKCQRQFVCEALKRAFGETSCLLKSDLREE